MFEFEFKLENIKQIWDHWASKIRAWVGLLSEFNWLQTSSNKLWTNYDTNGYFQQIIIKKYSNKWYHIYKFLS